MDSIRRHSEQNFFTALGSLKKICQTYFKIGLTYFKISQTYFGIVNYAFTGNRDKNDVCCLAHASKNGTIMKRIYYLLLFPRQLFTILRLINLGIIINVLWLKNGSIIMLFCLPYTVKIYGCVRCLIINFGDV